MDKAISEYKRDIEELSFKILHNLWEYGDGGLMIYGLTETDVTLIESALNITRDALKARENLDDAKCTSIE